MVNTPNDAGRNSDDSDETPSLGVGHHLATLRKLAGETQASLAAKMSYSTSMVSQVERGEAAASPAFVAAAAQALGVTVYDLYHQPGPSFGTERAHLAELETAVMAGFALTKDTSPPSFADLERRVKAVLALHRKSKYDASSAQMPGLLADLHTAAAQTTGDRDRERVHYLLATTYNAAMICLHRLGSPLSGQAAERAAAAAKFSGDPLFSALAEAEVGLPLMHRGAYDATGWLTDRALRSIDDVNDTHHAHTVHGFLHLRWAILAARQGNVGASDAHLAEAKDRGDRIPEFSDLYDTAFCRTNVMIHAVAAAVERGDGTTALSRREPLPPGADTMLTSRVAHHSVDEARAFLLHGDRTSAFTALLRARAVAPQLTRYHPQVHETLVVLAETDRRRSDSLSGFVRWAGLKLSA